jgi:hypothetical protein
VLTAIKPQKVKVLPDERLAEQPSQPQLRMASSTLERSEYVDTAEIEFSKATSYRDVVENQKRQEAE